MRAPLLVAATLLGLVVLTPQAQSATRTVTLTDAGPSPATLTVARGDRVRFLNSEGLAQHQVSGQFNWAYESPTLAPGESATTPAITSPGTYRYVDTRSLLVDTTDFNGSLILKATPAPSPSPTRSPVSSPTPQPTLSPPPVVTVPPPTGVPTPVATTAPTATSPPVVPSSAAASPAPDIRYGAQGSLVQGSPHRYGLPVLMGAVAIGGVVSLLVRFLLSMAPAGRRTDW